MKRFRQGKWLTLSVFLISLEDQDQHQEQTQDQDTKELSQVCLERRYCFNYLAAGCYCLHHRLLLMIDGYIGNGLSSQKNIISKSLTRGLGLQLAEN